MIYRHYYLNLNKLIRGAMNLSLDVVRKAVDQKDIIRTQLLGNGGGVERTVHWRRSGLNFAEGCAKDKANPFSSHGSLHVHTQPSGAGSPPFGEISHEQAHDVHFQYKYY